MKNIPDDIKKLSDSISKAKQKERIDQQNIEQNGYTASSSFGFQMSIELLAGILVGGSIGYFLDDLFDFKPYLLIIFLLMGGAAGFLNAYRTAKTFEKTGK